MPPSIVYNPVSTITITVPIQKLLMCTDPMLICISGSRVPNTTPPAKMPTAIFDTINVISDTIDSMYREAGEKRRSRNSGIVNTCDLI